MSNYTEITLVSDDAFSNEHFPDNTLNNFTNIFDHCLRFDYGGEIAIKKVTFYSSMWTINKHNRSVYFVTTKRNRQSGLQKFELPIASFKTQTQFIDVFNICAESSLELNNLRNETGSRVFERGDFIYPSFQYKVLENIKLYLHMDILKQLGYHNLITNEYDDNPPDGLPNDYYLLPGADRFDGVSIQPMNFKRADPTLQFSCSMAAGTHIYGHQRIKSMLEVSTANCDNELVNYSPTHLSFYPLSKKEFTDATITINTREGGLAPLVFGPVVVELVIRERETTHLQL